MKKLRQNQYESSILIPAGLVVQVTELQRSFLEDGSIRPMAVELTKKIIEEIEELDWLCNYVDPSSLRLEKHGCVPNGETPGRADHS